MCKKTQSDILKGKYYLQTVLAFFVFLIILEVHKAWTMLGTIQKIRDILLSKLTAFKAYTVWSVKLLRKNVSLRGLILL